MQKEIGIQEKFEPELWAVDVDQSQFEQVLLNPYINACFYEFRLNRQLLAVAAVDMLREGISAVYTFFDPPAVHRPHDSNLCLDD